MTKAILRAISEALNIDNKEVTKLWRIVRAKIAPKGN